MAGVVESAMAISATYYRNTNPLTIIRSLQATPTASGLMLPNWMFNSAFQFLQATSGISATSFSGTTQFGTAGSTGVSGGGVYAALYGTSMDLLVASGGVSQVATALSGTVLFNDMTTAGGTPFAVNGSGQVFKLVGSAWSQVGNFGVASYGLVANSTPTLYSLQTALGRLGTMTTAGVSGTLATPMTFPAILAASSGVNIAVGGWNTTTLVSGFTAMAADPVNTTTFALSHLATSGISIWAQGASGTYVESQFVSGAGQNVSLAWSANGNFILGADTTNGAVHVFTSSFGVVSLTQTITLTGAAAVAIALDSQHALACQPGSNQVQGLGYNGSTWATSGAAIPIGNPKSIIALSSTQMLVGCSSGLATLTFSVVSGWNITNVSGIGFVPTALDVDVNGGAYAATATSGSNGLVYYNGASGSYVGSASGVVVQQGQIITTDPTNNVYRMFTNIGGTITQQASGAFTGAQAVGNVGNYVLIGSTTTSTQFQWGQPFTLNNVKTGQVSIYNGTSFSTLTLGAGVVPTAMAFDASNNLTITTQQNGIVVYNPVASSVAQSGSMPIFLGQSQSTPYGIASLTWASGLVWATSSMNESIAAISGVTL